MKLSKLVATVLVVLALGMLTACSDGGSSSNTKPAAKKDIPQPTSYEFIDKTEMVSGALDKAQVEGDKIIAGGWAVDIAAGKPAKIVALVDLSSKKVLAEVSVVGARPDVAKAANKPDYENSGYTMVIPTAGLPSGKITVAAYVVDKTAGKAYRFGAPAEILIN